jgi:NDP-sugar pyrophosphorylase family protein
LATLVVSERQTQRYLQKKEKNCLCGWTNIATGEVKPADLQNINNLKKLAFAGIQILSPQILNLLEKMSQTKFSLTDFYLQNAKNQCITACIPPSFKILDIGKIDSLQQAEKFFSNNIN